MQFLANKEYRMEYVTNKVKLTVNHVTRKKDMIRDENPQKNPHKRVTKTTRRRGEKSNQHPELVPVRVNVVKSELKMNYGKQTEWRYSFET